MILNCTHAFHTNCFFLFAIEKTNTHQPFNCPQCQDHIFPQHMFPFQLNQQQEEEDDDAADVASDVDSEQLEMEMLDQLWESNPDFKAKADELKRLLRERDKAQKQFGTLHKTALTAFKTQIATTVQVLKGTAKQAYTSLIHSPEYKAKQKTNGNLVRKFSALAEQVNSNRWELRRFLRRKGYRLQPFFYHTRYSLHRIQREFTIKLV